MKKEVYYDLDQDAEIEALASALSSPIRRKMIALLRKGTYTINEISCILNQPLSTVSFHIALLKKAHLINISVKAGAHGSAKMVSRKCDILKIGMDDINAEPEERLSTQMLEIPIGGYSEVCASNICGIANDKEIIGVDDMPGVFYHPDHYTASLLWFSDGYVEYRIPNYYLYGHKAFSLNVSLELCSEAPNFNMEWPSDITFWINGVEVCTYLSTGDYGERRGMLNPKWWSDYSTQYGLLKNIKIDGFGTYIDEKRQNEMPIDDLHLEKGEYFTLRIGIKEDAKHKGGLNIFGKSFGDYAQDIIIRVEYM